MTVVGLQKNILETLSIKTGGPVGLSNLPASEASEFLQILSMLSDTGTSDISAMEGSSVETIATNAILERYKAIENRPQFNFKEGQLEALSTDIDEQIVRSGEDIAKALSSLLTEENLNDFKALPHNNTNGENKGIFRSEIEPEIIKIQKVIEVLKTTVEQTSDDLPDKNLRLNLDVVDRVDNNEENFSSKFINSFYSTSKDLDETLNLKVLDDPSRNIVTLNSAETFTSKNGEQVKPIIPKVFMSLEPKFEDVSDAGDLVKVNISLGSEYTDIQVINSKGVDKAGNLQIANPPLGEPIGLEIDKSKVKALLVSVSSLTTDDLNIDIKSQETSVPNIALIFDKSPVSSHVDSPSVRVTTIKDDISLRELISRQGQLDNSESSGLIIKADDKLAAVEDSEMPKPVNFNTKFSDLGTVNLNIDRQQIKGVIDGLLSNLSFFSTEENEALVSRNNFSEIIRKNQNSEQINRVASLIVLTALNFETSSPRSNLLTSTSNVLRFREGLQKFVPRFGTQDNHFFGEKNEFESIIPVEKISSKDHLLFENSLTSQRLFETNTMNSYTSQIQSQPNVITNQNAYQLQSASSSANSSIVSNNTLQVFDAQFNSRLGMLLTERVAMGRENFELQLEPESFGKVRVNVSLDNSTLEVKMVAESTGTVSILRGAEGLLQSITDQSGLKLSEYSVEMQNNNENSKNNGNNDRRNAEIIKENTSKTEEMKGNELGSTHEDSDQLLNLLA